MNLISLRFLEKPIFIYNVLFFTESHLIINLFVTFSIRWLLLLAGTTCWLWLYNIFRKSMTIITSFTLDSFLVITLFTEKGLLCLHLKTIITEIYEVFCVVCKQDLVLDIMIFLFKTFSICTDTHDRWITQCWREMIL